MRVADIPGDYYVYLEESYQLMGEHTRKTFNLGQRVTVEVVGSDKLTKTIDFRLLENEEEWEE